MTKEQFLKMKSDFKNVIEATKINKKYYKSWKNAGFTSEEEYREAEKNDYIKCDELLKDIKHIKGKWVRLYGDVFTSHWAYYCAKHQLFESERKKYISQEFAKMKECNQNTYSLTNLNKRVEEIISLYEEIVCAD